MKALINLLGWAGLTAGTILGTHEAYKYAVNQKREAYLKDKPCLTEKFDKTLSKGSYEREYVLDTYGVGEIPPCFAEVYCNSGVDVRWIPVYYEKSFSLNERKKFLSAGLKSDDDIGYFLLFNLGYSSAEPYLRLKVTNASAITDFITSNVSAQDLKPYLKYFKPTDLGAYQLRQGIINEIPPSELKELFTPEKIESEKLADLGI